MKSLKISLVALLAFLGSAAFAQSKTDSVKVSGNCGMCKSRIEKAMKLPGVTASEWSAKTKMLTLSFDTEKINLDTIQQIIAGVGHDTPKYKATEEVYSKLPGCCKYDRVAESIEKPKSIQKL